MYHCPKCLKKIEDESRHSACEYSVVGPLMEDAIKTWCVVLGDSNQGKSTYVESLLEVLKKLPSRLPGFAINGIDAHSKTMLLHSGNSTYTSPATLEMPSPILLDCFDFPSSGAGTSERQSIFLYDTPGEFLSTGSEFEVGAIRNVLEEASVLWLLYELSPEGQHGDRIPLGEVLSNLIVRLQKLNVPIEGKTVVVTYTMTQRLLGCFPQEIQTYLNSDPSFGHDAIKKGVLSRFDLDAYMREALRISKVLEELTESYSHGGALLLKLANRHGLRLRFCVTESIGHDVSDGKLHDQRTPKRVLDPLLWATYRTEEPGSMGEPTRELKKVRVLIDPEVPATSPWYAGEYLKLLWQKLEKHARLDFYFMGRQQPEVMAPAAPPAAPPKRTYVPLIGPLLDDVNKNSVVLIISDEGPKDLMDFQFSEQADRLKWLVCDEEARDRWNHTLLIRNVNDIAAVVLSVRN